MTRTWWTCERCGARNWVEHKDREGAYEILTKLMDSHSFHGAPDCEWDPAGVRVSLGGPIKWMPPTVCHAGELCSYPTCTCSLSYGPADRLQSMIPKDIPTIPEGDFKGWTCIT